MTSASFGFNVGAMGYSYWDLVELPWPEAQGSFVVLKTLHLCQERARFGYCACMLRKDQDGAFVRHYGRNLDRMRGLNGLSTAAVLDKTKGHNLSFKPGEKQKFVLLRLLIIRLSIDSKPRIYSYILRCFYNGLRIFPYDLFREVWYKDERGLVEDTRGLESRHK
jgi:hypothetical protein